MVDDLGSNEFRRARPAHRLAGPGWWIDASLVTLLIACTFVVHPFHYLMRYPYWADESWVAALSRAPVSQFVSLSSSTPIGWMLLLRLLPLGTNSLRVLPLSFAAAAVLVAYLLARSLPWKTTGNARFAAVVAALAALLAPTALLEQDLKQYTAEAFFALLLLLFAGRLQVDWTRRKLVAFAAVSVLALPFATTSALVAVALYGGLLVSSAAARNWAHVREVLVAGMACGALIGVYFGVVILPHTNPALRRFWTFAYLDGTPADIASVVWHRFENLHRSIAMPSLVLLALLAIAFATLAKMKLPALAIAVPLLWLEMLIAGVANRYPFLDRRTSHFLLVVTLVIASIGFSAAVVWIASRTRVVAVLAVVAAALVVANNVQPYLRIRAIPNEDVRSQVRYVAEHRKPNEPVVVSWQSNFGFGYYWPGAGVKYRVDDLGSNGFMTRTTNIPDVVQVRGRAPANAEDGIRRAVAMSRRDGAGKPSRIWLIRTHQSGGERQGWTAAFRSFGLVPRNLPVGSEPLTVLEPASSP